MVSVEPFKGSTVNGVITPGLLSGDPKWPVFHFTDDADPFNIWIVMSCPTLNTVTVSYEIGGSALEGVHYSSPLGANQVVFSPGNTRKSVRITPLESGLYYEEVFMSLRLTSLVVEGTPDPGGREDVLSTLEQELEVHAYFRPATATAPVTIEWATPTSLVLPGVVAAPVCQTVGAVNVGTVNLNRVDIWLEQTGGDAEEGRDYLFGTATDTTPTSGALVDPNGNGDVHYTINPNANQRTCFVSILAGATPGRTLELTLMHEPSDRSQENRWTYTGGWEFDYQDSATGPNGELGSAVYPGEPGNLTPGPAPIEPPNPYVAIRDVVKKDPWGNTLWGLRQRSVAQGAGYVRKNSEIHVQCGQPVGTSLIPMSAYNRFSVYVDVPTDGAGPPGSPLELTRIGFRERGSSYGAPVTTYSAGTDYQAIFNRNHPGPTDANGDPIVVHPSGRWGVEYSEKVYNNGVSSGTVTCTFTDETPSADTIERASGSWADDGFLAGHVVNVTGTESNDGAYTLATVTDLVLTLDAGDSLSNETSSCVVEVDKALPLDSACGLVTETWRNAIGDTATLLRLWITVHEDDSVETHLGNQQNVINWPVFDDASVSVDRGLLFFWPVWEHSDSVDLVAEPLPRYWPRAALQWEPRGRACVVNGGNNTHTITIA